MAPRRDRRSALGAAAPHRQLALARTRPRVGMAMSRTDSFPYKRLNVVPVTFSQAYAFIAEYHRTHRSPVGMKCAIGAATTEGELVGVLIASRPVARHFDF